MKEKWEWRRKENYKWESPQLDSGQSLQHRSWLLGVAAGFREQGVCDLGGEGALLALPVSTPGLRCGSC